MNKNVKIFFIFLFSMNMQLYGMQKDERNLELPSSEKSGNSNLEKQLSSNKIVKTYEDGRNQKLAIMPFFPKQEQIIIYDIRREQLQKLLISNFIIPRSLDLNSHEYLFQLRKKFLENHGNGQKSDGPLLSLTNGEEKK